MATASNDRALTPDTRPRAEALFQIVEQQEPSAGGQELAGEAITFAGTACSLGTVLVAATARGVCAILIGDDAAELHRDLERRFPRASLSPGGKGFEAIVSEVAHLIERPTAELGLPLDLRGTEFQRRVWRALQHVPPGATATYREIAAAIGQPRAVRAVAAACAANPLALAVPCHRVVRSDGGLSGYRWGVGRKRALLAAEAAARPGPGS